ncbi:MAG TPA: kynureninase [candidate division Zixibacteria bacterium]|nr:kynureninase [candidate division Zixibacteria bacterium]
MDNKFEISEDFAKKLDAEDTLAQFRERFYIPQDTIYVDGNSLGLLSKDSETSLLRVINEWKTLAINGWFIAERPWYYFSEDLGKMIAPLVGAKTNEVVATGTTTVNIHALISSFYVPKGKKTKILADVLNFPTDIYALRSQIELKGLDPQEHLVLAPSSDGRYLDEKIIIDLMTDDIALIFLPSVLFRNGQLLDMSLLTKEAHKRDILIGFDCSHSVGAIPHYFNKWEVDFAVWCSYKYMNSGPGSSAYLYVNEKHFDRKPGLVGWFGNNKDTQFNMSLDFEPSDNAGRWQISSPGIIGAAAMEGAVKIILEAGIEAIREKSLKLTSYLIYLIDEILSKEPYNFIIGSPRDIKRRGGHIALEREEHSFEICEALKSYGVVPDFRPKNIIRIAPSALYNTFHDIWQIVQYLKKIIDRGEYL